MTRNTTDDRQGAAERSRSLRRAVPVVLKRVVLTVVVLWVAPSLSVSVSGAAISRDSALAILACVTRIPDALSVVTEECKRTTAEQAAFEEFSTRIAALEATAIESPPATTGAGFQPSETETAASLEDVRAAYRDTVMAVAHYEEEYDEPRGEHMAAEFGPDLAGIVESNDVLTPQLQAALIQASDAARQERTSFCRTLDREHDALTDARQRLRAVSDTTDRLTTTPLSQRSFDDVLGAESRLQPLKADCETLLEDRQQHLHEGPSRDGIQLQEYLYGPRSWTFPVLDDTLDCLSRLREIERRIVQAVSRRR
jgi:hypothetical protein